MSLATAIFDTALEQALQILRFAAAERNIAYTFLDSLEKEIVAEIAVQSNAAENQIGYSPEAARAILEQEAVNKIIENVNEKIDKYFDELSGRVTESGLSQLVAGNSANNLQILIGAAGIDTPKASFYEAVKDNTLIFGSVVSDWWGGQAQSLKDRFAGELRQGLLNGETNQELIARVIGKLGQPGIMDTARNQAAALVQTSVQAVANGARRQVFQQNSDIIQGIRQVSTLDSRTTLTCIAYSNAEWDLDYNPINGNVLPYNGGVPRHWNCRSVEIPILVSASDLGLPEVPESERSTMFGPAEESLTFDEFLKRQGEQFQNEVLGEGRAELWREGKITLRDLVNGVGRELTLEELRAAFG